MHCGIHMHIDTKDYNKIDMHMYGIVLYLCAKFKENYIRDV